MTPGIDDKALGRRYPVFSAFGESPRHLSGEDEAMASFDDRIASVWHFLAKQVLSFVETLKPRERASHDPEDLIIELFCKLREKDAKWAAERGRYITFAGAVAAHELSSLRDKARTVASPRNASGRMKEYQAEADAGTITEKRAKTFADIQRTVEAPGDVEFASTPSDARVGVEAADPKDVAVQAEAARLVRDAIVQSIRVLTFFEARVVGETYGLWGKPVRSLADVAARAGKTVGEVRRAKASAGVKIRGRLTELAHPAVMPDE